MVESPTSIGIRVKVREDLTNLYPPLMPFTTVNEKVGKYFTKDNIVVGITDVDVGTKPNTNIS